MKDATNLEDFAAALFAVFILVALIVGVAFLCSAIGDVVIGVSRKIENDPCWADKTSTACRIQRVDECLATERFTEDQCVNLVGGGGK
jgi:hypothetical protein